MDELVQRVLDFIRREGLILDAVDDTAAAGGKRVVVVAVSGGPDSVCLLHVLNMIKKPLGVRLHVAHLNHMLRGADSNEDARYVERLACSLRIASTVESRDVQLYRKEHKLSLEEAARQVRYDFFAHVAASIGAECVALGHTEDDQVETVLMHLVRGAGLAGLRGMLPVSDMRLDDRGSLRVIRPLLEITRKETENYCLAHNLKPRSDVTNDSLDYTRNRFRHELMPILRRSNSNIGATIRRVTRSAADEMSFMEAEVDRVWNTAVSVNPVSIALNTSAVLALHPALQRCLLRRVMHEALGNLADVESVHIEKMMESLRKPAGKRISLLRGLKFYVSYDICLLTKDNVGVCPLPEIKGVHRLKAPGMTLLQGWRVKADLVSDRKQEDGFSAYIDLDACGTQLTVRRRQDGDRFQPLGMTGRKKLQDFMVDAKIPGIWRDRVPLVCSGGSIIWVVGWRISDSVKITDSTRRILHISFERSD